MPFVNIALLAGGLFIAVPVILHLIMRREPKRLEFPALRFVRQRRETNTRRLRLRHLILLLMRMAAILLLSFALARPSIRSAGFLSREAPVAAVLLFDTTPKMDYEHRNQTRLQQARQIAHDIVARLPRDSRVLVMSSHSALSSSEADRLFAADLGVARTQIDRLKTSPVARPLPEQLGAALEALAKSEADEMRREIYVFTDQTEPSWQSDNPGQLRAKLHESDDVGLYVIDVGVEKPRNFGLGKLRLARQVLARKSPLDVTVELNRFGPEAERKIELWLTAPGETAAPQKRDERVVQWEAGAASIVDFRVRNLEAGVHQGYVEIVGDDGLSADNILYFTVDVRDAWPVLVVADNPREAVYVTEAIAPADFRERGQSRFELTTVSADQLAQHRLADYAAVFLIDPPPLAELGWDRLAEYVREGGSAAIMLGDRSDLAAFNEEAPQVLLPGKLKWHVNRETYLAPDDLNHPLLARFRPLEGSVPWRNFPVYKYWALGELAEGVDRVLAFANNEAALLEKPLGKGRAVTMTTPVTYHADPQQPPWNRLATGPEPWPFVMLMNEMTLYLVGNRDERFNFQAGQLVRIPLTGQELPQSVSLKLPDGTRTSQSVDVRRAVVSISNTSRPGNYLVTAGGSEARLERGFSVNVPDRWCRLERATDQQLEELLGKARYRKVADAANIEREQSRGRIGQELFPYLMGLLAIILALEHTLANRFYRSA